MTRVLDKEVLNSYVVPNEDDRVMRYIESSNKKSIC